MENIKGMICDMEGIEGRSIMPVSRFYGFNFNEKLYWILSTNEFILKCT